MKLTYLFIYLYSFINKKFHSLIVIFLFSLYLCLRDFTQIIDINLYSLEFSKFQNGQSIVDSSLFWKGEYFFLILMYILKFMNLKIFFFTYHFISLFIFVYSIKKIFRYFFRLDNINFIPFIFLSYGFILLYSNVIRQGMALSIMLLGISYYLDNKKKLLLYV